MVKRFQSSVIGIFTEAEGQEFIGATWAWAGGEGDIA